MKKPSKNNFVTNETFASSMIRIDQKFEWIEKNMATKDDVQVILNTIDAFTKKVTVHENKALVHDHRLNEIEPKIEDHERRIAALESR